MNCTINNIMFFNNEIVKYICFICYNIIVNFASNLKALQNMVYFIWVFTIWVFVFV